MRTTDATFAALADPTRRDILTRLSRGEATVTELAAPFDISQPAISRHLKVLEAAGLISRRVVGSTRPCRLEPRGFDALEQWLASLRESCERNYQRLDGVLAALQTPPEEPST